MSELAEAIVLDNGSGSIKAGLSGENLPKCILPAVIGQLKEKPSMTRTASTKSSRITGTPTTSELIGVTPQQTREMASIAYPIERGVITNWEAMEKIWKHTINHELCVNPESAHMPVSYFICTLLKL